MIRYECALCAETMESPQSQVGYTERCPKCGLGNVVPLESASPDNAPAEHLLKDTGDADLADLAAGELKGDQARARCDRLDRWIEPALTPSAPPGPARQGPPSLQRPDPPQRAEQTQPNRSIPAVPYREVGSAGRFSSRLLLALVILTMTWVPAYRVCRAFAEAKIASALSSPAESSLVDTPRP